MDVTVEVIAESDPEKEGTTVSDAEEGIIIIVITTTTTTTIITIIIIVINNNNNKLSTLLMIKTFSLSNLIFLNYLFL